MTAETPPATPSAARRDALAAGTCFALVSALGYTAANVALREAARPGDAAWALWVSCIKSVPSAAAAGVILLARRSALPDLRTVGVLVLTGLVMQFGGNGFFQWSLGVVGLAVTVPLTFATLIGSGALLGRAVLGEPITARSLASMATLVVSISLLSLGARGSAPVNVQAPSALLGVFAACVSGIAYGGTGVVIRRAVTGDAGLAATLGILSATGVVALGLTSLATIGPRGLLDTPPGDMTAMWAAGVFNAVGFFAVSAALGRAPVVWVNLVNSSQIAMCSAAGVLWFHERLTAGILAGIALTIAGLSLLDRRANAAPRRLAIQGDEAA